jgi:hypothetical protein
MALITPRGLKNDERSPDGFQQFTLVRTTIHGHVVRNHWRGSDKLVPLAGFSCGCRIRESIQQQLGCYRELYSSR